MLEGWGYHQRAHGLMKLEMHTGMGQTIGHPHDALIAQYVQAETQAAEQLSRSKQGLVQGTGSTRP